jgi:hypothetical protein
MGAAPAVSLRPRLNGGLDALGQRRQRSEI